MIFFLFAVAAALVFAGAPIAYAIGASALTTFLVFLGHLPAEVVAQRVLGSVDKFTLIAIPLFILGGELMNTGGLTDRLVRLCRAILGPIRGGLGLVTVGTGVFLAGISGSGTADAAGLAKCRLRKLTQRCRRIFWFKCLLLLPNAHFGMWREAACGGWTSASPLSPSGATLLAGSRHGRCENPSVVSL